MPSDSLSTANYAAVIKDLRAKRDELDRTIAMLEAMAHLPAAQAQADVTAERNAPARQATTASSGIGDACAKVLEASRAILSTREVYAILVDEGFEFGTENPINNVWSALNHRSKVTRDVRRAGRGRWKYVTPPAEKPTSFHQLEASEHNGLAPHQ